MRPVEVRSNPQLGREREKKAAMLTPSAMPIQSWLPRGATRSWGEEDEDGGGHSCAKRLLWCFPVRSLDWNWQAMIDTCRTYCLLIGQLPVRCNGIKKINLLIEEIPYNPIFVPKQINYEYPWRPTKASILTLLSSSLVASILRCVKNRTRDDGRLVDTGWSTSSFISEYAPQEHKISDRATSTHACIFSLLQIELVKYYLHFWKVNIWSSIFLRFEEFHYWK
jgi:hypothetical protein